jgi:hypothetical protein
MHDICSVIEQRLNLRRLAASLTMPCTAVVIVTIFRMHSNHAMFKTRDSCDMSKQFSAVSCCAYLQQAPLVAPPPQGVAEGSDTANATGDR